MKNKLLFLLLLACACVSAQDRKSLRGKVVSGETPLSGIFVINNKTGEETKTDAQGNFTIKARRGDALAVYSDKTDVREFAVSEASFKEQPFIVSVNFKAYELEEVVVEDTFNQPTGIPQPDVMSPAEKKAAAGVTLVPKPDANVQGLAINTDAVINAVTGKRKALKRAREAERKEKNIQTMRTIYTEAEMQGQLGIPAENIEGFLFHCAGSRKVEKAMKAGDLQLVKELMASLAIEYSATLKDEK